VGYYKKDPNYNPNTQTYEKFDKLLEKIKLHIPVQTSLNLIGMSRFCLDKLLHNDDDRRAKYYEARARSESNLTMRIVEMANNEKRPDPKPLQWLLSKTNPGTYGKFRDDHVPVNLSNETREALDKAELPQDKIKVLADAVMDKSLDLLVAERLAALIRQAHPELKLEGNLSFDTLIDVPDNSRLNKLKD